MARMDRSSPAARGSGDSLAMIVLSSLFSTDTHSAFLYCTFPGYRKCRYFQGQRLEKGHGGAPTGSPGPQLPARPLLG